MKNSLVISTYNWPEALNICLESVKKQSVLPTEIIIADDGSDVKTAELISLHQKNFPVPVLHVWQPDEGFQLAKIRNKAFAKASTDYLIQIDGDLILHPHFIKDHLSIAAPGYFITGSRVLLQKKITEEILQTGDLDELKLFIKNSKNFFNGLRIKPLRNFMATRYKQTGKHTFYVKGCNMAFWKNDLIKVNGYDESFTGWGKEDSEIAIRLINAAVKKKFLKMGGIAYHLFHKEVGREKEKLNTQLMQNAIDKNYTSCKNGLNKYLPSFEIIHAND
ncbi:MAG: glycosyltransferase family 2 protein [Chitinophagaceae bacterium]